MHLGLLVAAVLSQAAEAPAVSTPAAEADDAAQRTAAAAERAAKALETLAEKLAPAEPKAPAPPPPPAPAPSAWEGSVGFSLISLTGNAETLTLSTTGAASRQWGAWKLALKANGAYGQTRPADGAQAEVVALNAGAQVRGERKLTSIASAFLLAGADTDHVKSVEYRAYGEGGAAIVWVERKAGDDTLLSLRTDLGLRYANESRFQYFPTPAPLPDVTLVAPKLGLGFRYMLNQHVVLVEEAEVMTNVMGDPRVVVNSLTRINARLTESLSLSAGFQLSHDSLPAAGKKPTDTILSLGAELAF